MADNTWTEAGITYSNAPAMGTQLGSSGTFSAGTCPLRHAPGVLRKTSVDVTSYITGNGIYNLAFSTTSSTNISFSSREGANAPQLVIETSSGPTNTPAPSNTPGPTSTATTTATLTPVGSNTPTVPPTVTPTTPPVFTSAQFAYDGDGKQITTLRLKRAGARWTDARYVPDRQSPRGLAEWWLRASDFQTRCFPIGAFLSPSVHPCVDFCPTSCAVLPSKQGTL